MSTEAMVIGPDMIPELTYVLRNSAGTVVDRTAGVPMVYLHGRGQILAPLEAALVGLSVGEHVEVTIPPAQGHGEPSGKTVRLKKKQFGKDVPRPGDVVFASQGQGPPPEGVPAGGSKGWAFVAGAGADDAMKLRVLDDRGAWLTLTPDHPLAGETLHFWVDVVGLRAASADELEHGHAHVDQRR